MKKATIAPTPPSVAPVPTPKWTFFSKTDSMTDVTSYFAQDQDDADGATLSVSCNPNAWTISVIDNQIAADDVTDVMLRMDDDKAPVKWPFFGSSGMVGVLAPTDSKKRFSNALQIRTNLTSGYLFSTLSQGKVKRIRARVIVEPSAIDLDFNIDGSSGAISTLEKSCPKRPS